MTKKTLNLVLVTAASVLLAAGASAEPSKNAAAPADKAAEAKPKGPEAKPEGKALGVKGEEPKAADKAAKPGDTTATTTAAAGAKTTDGPGKSGDRAARKAAQQEKLRVALTALKTPMSEAMKQEVRRHAQRLAKIERIKSVATETKDKDVAERADKLLEKENARHDKWMANAATKTTAGPENAKTEAKVDMKGGAR